MSANRTRRIFAARAAALLAVAAAVAGPGGCNEPNASPQPPRESSREGFAGGADSICTSAQAEVISQREEADQLAQAARPARPPVLRERLALVAALRREGPGRQFRELARDLGMHVCATPYHRP